MDRLLVAKISKPQGIKGELKCQLLTDVLAVFNGEVLDFDVSGRTMHAEKVSVRQGALYIKFQGVDTRNDAELFRNKDIFLSKDIIQKFLDNEVLVDDLIGAVLYDEKGDLVGQIVDYENYGASDILTILENGHQYQVPFILSIFNIGENSITVNRKAYNENKI